MYSGFEGLHLVHCAVDSEIYDLSPVVSWKVHWMGDSRGSRGHGGDHGKGEEERSVSRKVGWKFEKLAQVIIRIYFGLDAFRIVNCLPSFLLPITPRTCASLVNTQWTFETGWVSLRSGAKLLNTVIPHTVLKQSTACCRPQDTQPGTQ